MLPNKHPEPDRDTAAVHAGALKTPVNQPTSPPLYLAAAYQFADLDQIEAISDGDVHGIFYGRYGNPNALQFAEAVAELERGKAAVATANSMAAIDAVLHALVPENGAIVVSRELYGGTYAVLKNDYAAPRARVFFVDATDLVAVSQIVERERPAVLYIESLTNPRLRIANIPELAKITQMFGTALVVDSTFATPMMIRPLSLGADIVVHSATKYLGGHGDLGAGVVVGSLAKLAPIRARIIRAGTNLSAFDSWLALRGVRTLGLRMARHAENAVKIAAYLASQPSVSRVHHPSRNDHPEHELAATLFPMGTGGIVAFDLRLGRPAVEQFLSGLRMITLVNSLGEIATTVSYSAVASHRAMSSELRGELGVTEGTLRISAGIEAIDDILHDLAGAFAGLSSEVHA